MGSDFLEKLQGIMDRASIEADIFSGTSGEKLPSTLTKLGSVLSVLYRLSCCSWGCKGGDHQIEWMSGRIVNQSASAHRLIRSGYYDEALMLIRGIGEMANLLWLFAGDPSAVKTWRVATAKERQSQFSPFAVRLRLETISKIGPPIDKERYSKLCEVGTHPMPDFAPGHFTGTGRPILGCVLQPAGVYVSMTELGYAVSMCAVPLSKLLSPNDVIEQSLHQDSVELLRSLGAFTILNYEDLLAKVNGDTVH